MNKHLKYIILLLIWLTYFYIGNQMQYYAKAQLEILNAQLDLFVLVSEIYFLFLGFLMGIDILYNEVKAEGKWLINAPKIIYLAIPAFIFGPLFTLNTTMIHLPLNESFIEFFKVHNYASIILGYSLTTSFNRRKL